MIQQTFIILPMLPQIYASLFWGLSHQVHFLVDLSWLCTLTCLSAHTTRLRTPSMSHDQDQWGCCIQIVFNFKGNLLSVLLNSVFLSKIWVKIWPGFCSGSNSVIKLNNKGLSIYYVSRWRVGRDDFQKMSKKYFGVLVFECRLPKENSLSTCGTFTMTPIPPRNTTILTEFLDKGRNKTFLCFSCFFFGTVVSVPDQTFISYQEKHYGWVGKGPG